MVNSTDSGQWASLPGAGQYVSGMGEAFALDLNSGQATYSVRIGIPEGVASWTPDLKLEYVHSKGQGPFGLGWSLPIKRIERRLDIGLHDFLSQERFLDGSMEITEWDDGYYRPSMAAASHKYRRIGDGWEAWDPDGNTYELGVSDSSRVADPEDPSRVQTWLIERATEPNGNIISYEWVSKDGSPYLKAVHYAVYSVVFTYEQRPDLHTDGRSGFPRILSQRCTKIEVHRVDLVTQMLLRSWSLSYDQAQYSQTSLLSSIQFKAHGNNESEKDDVTKPPQRFEYGSFDPKKISVQWMENPSESTGPPPMNTGDAALMLMDNLPLPGILQFANGRQVYWPNRGSSRWGIPKILADPSGGLSRSVEDASVLDVNGDATPDMLTGAFSGTVSGYFRNRGIEGWGEYVQYPRGANIGPPWGSNRVRTLDVSGDGTVDAVYGSNGTLVTYLNHREEGWSAPIVKERVVDEEGVNVDFSDPLIFLSDMNGDGLPDIVRVRSGIVEYWPSLGSSRFGPKVRMKGSPRLPNLSFNPNECQLVDVDGDGFADLVIVNSDRVDIWINQYGACFSECISRELIPPPIPGTVRNVNLSGRNTNGLVWNSWRTRGYGYVVLDFQPECHPHVLTKIDNEVGLTSTIGYTDAVHEAIRDRDAGNEWETHLPFPLRVVSVVKEFDAVTNVSVEVQYTYHGGQFDPQSRRFDGFRCVEKLEVGDDSRASVMTRHNFNVGQQYLKGNGPEHAAINRTLAKVQVFSLDGSPEESLPLTTEDSEYDIQLVESLEGQPKRVRPVVKITRKTFVERSKDSRTEERHYDYDTYGNATREVFRAFGVKDGEPVPELSLTNEIEYAINPELNIISTPCRMTKRSPNGDLLSEIRRFYDGEDFVGLPIGEIQKGSLTRIETLVSSVADFESHYTDMDAPTLGYSEGIDVDGNPGIFVQEQRRRFSPWGNVLDELDPLGNLTSYVYDPSGIGKIEEHNYLGTTFINQDNWNMQPASIVSPDGTFAEISYDAMGRIRKVAVGEDNLLDPTREYEYEDSSLPNKQLARYKIDDANHLQTVTFFDGKGEPVQSRVERQADEIVVSGWVSRNRWGESWMEYEPTLSTEIDFSVPDLGGKASRSIYYDGLGRPVKTSDYTGSESAASYKPFRTVTLGPDKGQNFLGPDDMPFYGTKRIEELDAMCRTISSSVSSPSGESMTISNQLGLMGQLIQMSDSVGLIASYQYDLLGRRIEIKHREGNSRRLWYNAKGEVIRTLDSNGNDVSVQYDPSGKISVLTDPSGSQEVYLYEGQDPGSLGRLSHVQYPGGSQSFLYNQLGQTTRETWRYDGDGQDYSTEFEYNSLGKINGVTYPDGIRVGYSYYKNGMINGVEGVIENIEYDARNLPIKIDYANGVEGIIQYTPGPGLVKEHRVSGPAGQVLQELHYGYDLANHMIAAENSAPGSQFKTKYDFDAFSQLSKMQEDVSGDSYEHNYEYSLPGRLSFLGDTGLTFSSEVNESPDKITGITDAQGLGFPTNYDMNGNLTSLPGRVLSYNFKNLLNHLVGETGSTVDYAYDYKNRLTRKRVSDNGTETDTKFLGNYAEIRNGSLAKFVLLGQLRIAVIWNGHHETIHSNSLGSSTFFTDAQGNKLSEIAYQPFGNVKSKNGLLTSQMFAMQYCDSESGLHYVGRRWYSPEIGRFTTPDPMVLYRPEQMMDSLIQLCPYTYCGNDPIDNIDPSGLGFWSVLGAVVGVVVGVALGVGIIAAIGIGFLAATGAILGTIAAVTVSYLIAKHTTGAVSEFFRGFMIGINAGLNYVLATNIFGAAVGIGVGILGFLTAFETISQSDVYQGILGWTQWLMPMSWLVLGAGAVIFVTDVITGGKVSIDWATGTIVVKGGFFANKNRNETAFNMGNFVFGHENADDDHLQHEVGHSLNLAAFGSIFHFVGAIDQNRAGGARGDAYAELLADSNDPHRTDATRRADGWTKDIIPMWG